MDSELPAVMTNHSANSARVPTVVLVSELAGTAVLVLAGLSFVIVDLGSGSPVASWIPDQGLRRLITGFLFGSTGGLLAVSPVGKHSGAHINPVVTLAFWMKGKMGSAHALGYMAAQLLGGILGALPLLAWGHLGASVDYGATTPGPSYGPLLATLGEVATTFFLIIGLLTFVGHKRLRRFTPMLFAPLYAVMVFLEAPISGTSTNPARSLGPAVISATWTGWWVYWIGPVVGTLLALAVSRYSPLRRFEIEVAKLSHFEHDPFGIFKIPKAP